MKLPSLKLSALAFAGLTALTASASAQITTAPGDIILGVYQNIPGTAGFGNVYEADLGTVKNFTSTANIDLSSKVSIADIQTIFGGVNNVGLSTLQYFVVGSLGSTGFSIGGVTPNRNSNVTTSTIVPNANSDSFSSSGTPASHIQALVADFGNGTVFAYSANSSVAADVSSGAISNDSGPQFGFNGINTSQSFTSAVPYYLLNSGTVTKQAGSFSQLGTFDFVNGTTFTYNGVAAVPEPSTYGLMGLGALLLAIVARRRASQV